MTRTINKNPTSGIYKITSPSGKIYIGQSANIERRWGYYKRYDCVGQTKLYNSFKKHGIEKHIFEIIHHGIENIDEIEKYYIDLFQSAGVNGLNLKSGGNVCKYSDESRLKMRNAKLGKKTPPHSEEHKQKIKESCLKRDFSYIDDDFRKRMSESQKGKKIPEEQIRKREETKRKNRLIKKLNYEQQNFS